MKKLIPAVLIAMFALITNISLAKSGGDFLIVSLNTLQNDLNDYVEAGKINNDEAEVITSIVDKEYHSKMAVRVAKGAAVTAGSLTSAAISAIIVAGLSLKNSNFDGMYGIFNFCTAAMLAAPAAVVGGIAGGVALNRSMFKGKDKVKVLLTKDPNSDKRMISVI